MGYQQVVNKDGRIDDEFVITRTKHGPYPALPAAPMRIPDRMSGNDHASTQYQ